ncbi:MAG: Lar family restriction alleviation protein [Desulfovibrio sp.]|nr:Lar family restriction alleviation protein [Desulfovibrio sp.]
MEQDGLKPKACPHCGSQDTYLAIRGDRHGFSVLCESCGLTGPSSNVQQHAVEAWNSLYIRKKGKHNWWFLRIFDS